MSPVHKARAMTVVFADDYTHSGVQRFIGWLMDTQGLSQFELSKKAGLSPAAIHQILKKREKDVTRPPRKSTLSALGKVINADVRFQSDKNKFLLAHDHETPDINAKQISLLLSEIGTWLASRKKRLTEEERERIVRVVKAMID